MYSPTYTHPHPHPPTHTHTHTHTHTYTHTHSSEPEVASKTKANVRTPYSVHELFGFDVMLDKRLKPWILEVNVSPSLHSNSPLDVNIKGVLIRDLLNIAGFTLPTPEQLSGE